MVSAGFSSWTIENAISLRIHSLCFLFITPLSLSFLLIIQWLHPLNLNAPMESPTSIPTFCFSWTSIMVTTTLGENSFSHCQSFDVSGHLDGTLLPSDDNDHVWKKRDGLVKLWLYGTLSKNLFKSTFKTWGTSQEIWLRLKFFFQDNKEAMAIQLDHKLRTKEIGVLTVHVILSGVKSIADLLANVDAPVSERTLVTYLLNGLNGKYDNIIKPHYPSTAFSILWGGTIDANTRRRSSWQGQETESFTWGHTIFCKGSGCYGYAPGS